MTKLSICHANLYKNLKNRVYRFTLNKPNKCGQQDLPLPGEQKKKQFNVYKNRKVVRSTKLYTKQVAGRKGNIEQHIMSKQIKKESKKQYIMDNLLTAKQMNLWRRKVGKSGNENKSQIRQLGTLFE